MLPMQFNIKNKSNQFLLAVALQEADEELHHPQSSFPKRHHDQHLTRERSAALEGQGEGRAARGEPAGDLELTSPLFCGPGPGITSVSPPLHRAWLSTAG